VYLKMIYQRWSHNFWRDETQKRCGSRRRVSFCAINGLTHTEIVMEAFDCNCDFYLFKVYSCCYIDY